MIPLGPRDPGPVHPDPARLPRRAVTRFAPAPTGYRHLGHLVNAVYTWGIAGATGGRVVLRIEDHDRGRCRPELEAALLDDLERLGLQPDHPAMAELRAGASAYRQSDDDRPYRDALERLRAAGLVYACDCSRATFAAWAQARGDRFGGPGCPAACRDRHVRERSGTGFRVALGPGDEEFDDLLLGPQAGTAASDGDLLVRDRLGNWTYHLCVVVDDARHGVDLVIRGRDLLDATPRQIRLGKLLGRTEPPAFLHHPLLRKPSGAKLSKADRDTALHALLEAGHTPADLFGFAAAAVGLIEAQRPITPSALGDLFVASGRRGALGQ